MMGRAVTANAGAFIATLLAERLSGIFMAGFGAVLAGVLLVDLPDRVPGTEKKRTQI